MVGVASHHGCAHLCRPGQRGQRELADSVGATDGGAIDIYLDIVEGLAPEVELDQLRVQQDQLHGEV